MFGHWQDWHIFALYNGALIIVCFMGLKWFARIYGEMIKLDSR
ncbi:hypothetical protein [Helicobacter canis]|nr:hypothetical protein [Helicobacter canis]